ncbi:hypothetical protein POM88_020868 [Heracleum sosnowskyi]|uniref:Uncharacterized protein n=1 Tax=Heracleum sosnowskyi TaxID=360622 RepID=A0AAD8MTA3_9APIA|nr:hypothetical protein POM88_020868 [Heracleum sosnowskyi]
MFLLILQKLESIRVDSIILMTKSREVDESVSSKDKAIPYDDVFQNKKSNASSSHVERVIVRDPSNFFVDLRMFENDYSIDYNDEEANNKDEDDEDEVRDEDNDEQSDNDDLLVSTNFGKGHGGMGKSNGGGHDSRVGRSREGEHSSGVGRNSEGGHSSRVGRSGGGWGNGVERSGGG